MTRLRIGVIMTAPHARSFILTKYRRHLYHRVVMKVTNREVASVQRDYPKIYLACHTRHIRKRNGTQLTAQESTVLAHLSATHSTRASLLAAHLGIGAPALSATLKRLTHAGLITRAPEAGDRRAVSLRLSAAGARVMSASSVLDRVRVARLLRRLSPEERQAALHGLSLLAKAALEIPKEDE
jgi:DNA-binding MarR family transcriptional regulator